jgi:hypothetical protein
VGLYQAGNLVVIHQRHLAGQHVVRLYQRVKRKRNHQKAVVAVARHLAEAAYWILKKQDIWLPTAERNSSEMSGADERGNQVKDSGYQ